MACYCEAGSLETLTELSGISTQFINQLSRLFKHIEYFDRCTCDAGRNRIREKVRPTFVPQQIHDFLGRSCVSTGCTSKCLAQSWANDINFALKAKKLWRAASFFTKNTSGMAFIHKSERSISLWEFMDLIQRRNITIHWKDAISHDDSHAAVLRIFQHLFEHIHVQVLVAQSACFAKSYAVDDACVVEFVGDNGIIGCETGFKEASIWIEATRIQDGIINLMEFRNSALKLLVYVLGSADKAHWGHSIAMWLQARLSSLHNPWMAR